MAALRTVDARLCRPVRSAKSDRQIVGHPGWDFALLGPLGEKLLFGLVPEGVHRTRGLAGLLPEVISPISNLFFAETSHVISPFRKQSLTTPESSLREFLIGSAQASSHCSTPRKGASTTETRALRRSPWQPSAARPSPTCSPASRRTASAPW